VADRGDATTTGYGEPAPHAAVDVDELSLRCDDGCRLAATRVCGGDAVGVVIASALGVPRRFYLPFARYLAERGADVLCFDYRGIDGSGAQADLAALKLEDWARLDLQAALCAQQAWSRRALALIGHSLGGQLPGLVPAAEQLDRLVLVGASSPWAPLYPLRPRLRMQLLWRVLIPWFSRGRTMFPARTVGLSSIDIPSNAVRDWSRWGLSRDYLFDPRHGLDLSRYARLRLPLLSYSFADDDFAVRPAIERLLCHYSVAAIERRHIGKPLHGSIGHFGYFRPAMRDSLWVPTADWLELAATPP
jgi:predicted alpha/beta hydrolase